MQSAVYKARSPRPIDVDYALGAGTGAYGQPGDTVEGGFAEFELGAARGGGGVGAAGQAGSSGWWSTSLPCISAHRRRMSAMVGSAGRGSLVLSVRDHASTLLWLRAAVEKSLVTREKGDFVWLNFVNS